MELALAILMVLGIFIGVPAVIGFAVAGAYILRDRQARRAELRKALSEELAQPWDETPVEQHVAQPAEKTLVGTH